MAVEFADREGEAVRALTVALLVPEPWREAIATAIGQLHREFPSLPTSPYAPHVSLCQTFYSDTPLPTVAGAIEAALCGAPPAAVAVDGVCTFDGPDGNPDVVYVGADSPWLRLAHTRLMRTTAAYRCSAPQGLPLLGNPAFDLAGFNPHITLLIVRDEPASADRLRLIAGRAAAVWAAHRPAGAGFAVTDVALSTWAPEAPDDAGVAPRIVRRLNLGARVGSAEPQV